MLFLTLAIVCSALISALMRMSEGRIGSKVGMLACNYMLCTLLAAVDGGQPFAPADGLGRTAALGAVAGVLYLGAFLLLQWNVSQNGVALPATFMKLGVLVPTLLAVTLFHETPRPAQGVGIAIALAAILLIQSGPRDGSARTRWGLPLLLLAGGLSDSMSKVYEAYGDVALQGRFLFFTFGTALLLCLLLCLLRREPLSWADAAFGLLVGLPNYFSSRFLLWSLRSLPAVAVYPTFSVGTIVLVTLGGRLFFKEKLTRRQLFALGLILAALALLNL